MRPWVLAEVNYAYVKQHPFEVAVLPLGATEPHNLHLPYGTDLFEATLIGERICEAAHRRGARVVLLPTIPFGTETNLREFPLAINVNPTTLFRFVADVIASVERSGVRKILILNSHGGNEMKPLLRELYGVSQAHLFLTNWYQILKDQYAQIFQHPDDHAGEMETSFCLAFTPQLVARHSDGTLAGDAGQTRSSRFEAVNKGWVSLTRPWHLLTTNSGSGYPHDASAAKGERLMQLVVERLGEFLIELAQAPLDAHFPFTSPS